MISRIQKRFILSRFDIYTFLFCRIIMSDNESGSGEEFEVEKIMEHRTRKGKVGAVNIETIVREINVVVRCCIDYSVPCT